MADGLKDDCIDISWCIITNDNKVKQDGQQQLLQCNTDATES